MFEVPELTIVWPSVLPVVREDTDSCTKSVPFEAFFATACFSSWLWIQRICRAWILVLEGRRLLGLIWSIRFIRCKRNMTSKVRTLSLSRKVFSTVSWGVMWFHEISWCWKMIKITESDLHKLKQMLYEQFDLGKLFLSK